MPNPNVVNDPQTQFTRMLQVYRHLVDYWAPIQRQRFRNYEFVTGKQWSKEDYDMLIRNRRSADVYNHILPVILALGGTQKMNRQALRAFPVGGGDEMTGEVITKAIRWSFQQSNKEFQFSRAWLDAVIGRLGWMKTYWSTQDTVEGMWYTQWHDPFRILFDPETQADFHKTCNFLFDCPWLTGDMLINLYAADNPDLAAAMQEQIDILEGNYGNNKTAPVSWKDKLALGVNVLRSAFDKERELSDLIETEWLDVRNGMYRVVEMHEKRYEKRTYLLNTQTGDTTLVPKAMQVREIIQKTLTLRPEMTVYEKREEVHYVSTAIPAFSSNPFAAMVQDKPQDIQNGMYCYNPVFCYNFHPDIAEGRSVVDALVDPQQAYNKVESTLKDYILRYVGHGWIYEEGSINPDDMQDWQSREVGIMRRYNNGKTAPKADLPEQLPREVLLSKADHRESISRLAGVNSNFQGESQTKNEASSLFAQRVQQAGLMQSTLLDSARSTDIILGRQAVSGLQHYLKDERWLRITDDEGNPETLVVNRQTVNGIVNRIDTGTYDVEIDTTSYSVTAKQEAFMQILALIQKLPPQLIPFHLVFEASDIPNKRAWVQWLQQRMGIPPAGAMPGMPGAGMDPRVMQMMHEMMVGGAGQEPVTRSLSGPAERVGSQ